MPALSRRTPTASAACRETRRSNGRTLRCVAALCASIWRRWISPELEKSTPSGSDFQWDEPADEYRCPQGRLLRSQWRAFKNLRTHITKADTVVYRSRKDRKKVEMLFAHLKRILKLDRLRLRGPSGAHDEFLPAATAQNLRRMARWLYPAEPETANMANPNR